MTTSFPSRRLSDRVDRRWPSVVGRTSSPPQEVAERSIGLRLARRVEEADSIEMIRDRAFIIGIAHRYGLAPVVMELVRLDMVGGSLATRDGLAEGGGLQDRGESAPAADTLAQIWRCWRRCLQDRKSTRLKYSHT